MAQRPETFTLNRAHPLHRGLVFAGLGRTHGSLQYRDSSPYGNHGTLTNMEPLTDWVYAPKLARWTLDYDGSNDYVNVTTKPYAAAAIKVRGATWATWALVDALRSSLTTAGLIGGAGSSSHDYYSAGGIYVGRGTDAYFVYVVIFDGAYKSAHSVAADIATVGWHHFAGVLNPADSKIHVYIDGIERGTATAVTLSGISIDPVFFVVGRQTGTGDYFWDGLGDSLCYVGALTAAELAALADPSNAMLRCGGRDLILPPRRRLIAVGAAGAPPAGAPGAVRRRKLLMGALHA